MRGSLIPVALAGLASFTGVLAAGQKCSLDNRCPEDKPCCSRESPGTYLTAKKVVGN